MLSIALLVFLLNYSAANNYTAERKCLKTDGTGGICTTHDKCAYIPPTYKDCGFGEICCPMVYYEWAKMKRQTAIDFPYAVRIKYHGIRYIGYNCGGILIEKKTVLTLALCLKLPQLLPPTYLTLGAMGSRNGTFFASSRVHPQDSNLALISIKKEYKKVACLSPSDFKGETAIVVGYATLHPESIRTRNYFEMPVIMKVNVKAHNTNNFTVSAANPGECLADIGSMVVTPGTTCKYMVVGIVLEWKDCGEDESVGEIKRVKNSLASFRSELDDPDDTQTDPAKTTDESSVSRITLSFISLSHFLTFICIFYAL